MPHTDSAPRELSTSGTGVGFRSTLGAFARERFAELVMVAGPGPAGAPHGSGSQALVPRRGGTASDGQFGLFYRVAGADSPLDSYHDELAPRWFMESFRRSK